MNEKFDYKEKKNPQSFYKAKTQHEQSQQTGGKSLQLISQRKGQFPSIDELLLINKKKRLKLPLKKINKGYDHPTGKEMHIS